MTRFRGDNWQAFDGAPIEIEYDTGGKTVSKAVFVINNGAIVKEYDNPTNPFYVSLDETDTKKLRYENIGNLILYDEQGRKETSEDSLIFYANEEVYDES